MQLVRVEPPGTKNKKLVGIEPLDAIGQDRAAKYTK